MLSSTQVLSYHGRGSAAAGIMNCVADEALPSQPFARSRKARNRTARVQTLLLCCRIWLLDLVLVVSCVRRAESYCVKTFGEGWRREIYGGTILNRLAGGGEGDGQFPATTVSALLITSAWIWWSVYDISDSGASWEWVYSIVFRGGFLLQFRRNEVLRILHAVAMPVVRLHFTRVKLWRARGG